MNQSNAIFVNKYTVYLIFGRVRLMVDLKYVNMHCEIWILFCKFYNIFHNLEIKSLFLNIF